MKIIWQLLFIERHIVNRLNSKKLKRLNMRAIAGLLAYLAIILIAVIMLVMEWIRKRKDNLK